MDLNTLWFLLIAVLYIGFFVLEGFDFGVGMLLPFLSKHEDAQKQDRLRRTIINTIGPHWDANEVWLLTAGGATFAAFPHWYATLFSGFYLALFLLLAALIVRGVAFEFRSKDENPKWRHLWDTCIFIGSALPALLLGVAFANLVRGVPIDADMNYVGTFFHLLNPYSIVAGLDTMLTFALYGAIFLALKTRGEVSERAEKAAQRLWLPALIVTVLLLVMTYFYTDILTKLGVNPGVIPITGAIAFLFSYYFIRRNQMGWAFVLVAISIAFAFISEFLILFPRVMVSSLNPDWSLTIYNASSSPYTLRVMTIIAVIFVPIVLVYQGWSYWVFRKRISGAPEELTY
ncbi:MAG: cytochrome d ubiquinol oxidase subunit II [Anaerolineae bacterium]|jgi:cytochrome d ubiquinol oxidase subunit II|nr:MAG: cytochrome d ubiquinol oxidase subunit II [Anaerolineae bacterium]